MAEHVTIVQVAARAGVAISSVSSALNDRPGVSPATRRRILKAAEELGYVPSLRGRSLSSKRAFAVGLVLQRDPDVLESDPFFASFIGGIESVIGSRGYALVLQMGSAQAETLDRYRRLAADRRVDGVFVSEIMIDDPRIPLLEELRLPAVGINSDRSGFPFPSVRQDHRVGIERLAAHLVELGHRKIAHISGPREFVHARHRETAWRAALAALGADAGPVVEGDFTYAGGVRAADTLLASESGATAVMCANDLMAIGFIARALDLGLKVPGDVSVAGYDGIEMGGHVRPTLTTLKTSPRRLGAEAARLLLDSVDGRDVEDVDIPPVELVVRTSTGVPAVDVLGGAA